MSTAPDTYGWTAVPRSQGVLLNSVQPRDPEPVKVADIPLPSSPVIDQVHAHAKANLPEETYNHSMRVFYYGQTLVKQHFNHFEHCPETFFLTCLLHDIGTTPTNMSATRMSFEFYGGFLSLNLLLESGAPKPQAESVTEAIIRHQDLGETGMISTVGQLIQLATVFDNMGQNSHLVHKETIESVVAAFPRKGWSGCFAKTIREEIRQKPWCHTTVIEGFAEGVENNKLMEPYD